MLLWLCHLVRSSEGVLRLVLFALTLLLGSAKPKSGWFL